MVVLSAIWNSRAAFCREESSMALPASSSNFFRGPYTPAQQHAQSVAGACWHGRTHAAVPGGRAQAAGAAAEGGAMSVTCGAAAAAYTIQSWGAGTATQPVCVLSAVFVEIAPPRSTGTQRQYQGVHSCPILADPRHPGWRQPDAVCSSSAGLASSLSCKRRRSAFRGSWMCHGCASVMTCCRLPMAGCSQSMLTGWADGPAHGAP